MMWLGAESNRRHVDFQSTALPTELPSRKDAHLSRKRQAPQPTILNLPLRTQRSPSKESIKTSAFSANSAVKLKRPRQLHRAPQQFQILVPRNFNRPKLLQMRRHPLGVEQGEFVRTQMLDQRD